MDSLQPDVDLDLSSYNNSVVGILHHANTDDTLILAHVYSQTYKVLLQFTANGTSIVWNNAVNFF